MGTATRGSSVGGFVPRIIGFVGSLVMLGYVLGRDALAGGRSFGKQIQGIRVVTGGQPIGVMESVKRNALFAIGSALGTLSATLHLVPCLGDAVACLLIPLQILGAFVTLAVAVIEIIKITQDPEGVRLGDQFANTRVVR